jgi:hypothetical protein
LYVLREGRPVLRRIRSSLSTAVLACTVACGNSSALGVSDTGGDASIESATHDGSDDASPESSADAASDANADVADASPTSDAPDDADGGVVICNGVTCPNGFKCCAAADGSMCAPGFEC